MQLSANIRITFVGSSGKKAQLYQRLVVELHFSASSLGQNGGLQTSVVNFHVAGVSAI